MFVFTIMVITMLLPLFNIPFILTYFIKIKGKINKWMCIPMGLMSGILGYNFSFKSGTQNDLTRYFATINNMRNQDFSTIIKNDNQMLYLKDILFYYVSRCSDVNVLSFIIGFIDYAIIFYILFDVINRYQILQQKNGKLHCIGMCLIVIGIISPFNIICNVRCVCSYILVGLAVYREYVQKKRNVVTVLLYFFPVGLHVSTGIFLGIRLILPLVKKIDKFLILIPILFDFIVSFLYELTINLNVANGTINMLLGTIRKAYYYLNWNSGGWATEIEKSISDRLNRGYGLFFISFIVILYFLVCWRKEKRYNKVVEFVFLIAVLSLGCLNIKTGAFWRFEAIVAIFSIEILAIVILEYQQLKKYLYILYATAGVMFVLNIIHMSRNTLFGNIIAGFCLTSPIKILFELLYGLFNMI